MKEFNVYIDESGDEGIHRGSKYFILTALVVDKEEDLEISKFVDKMKSNLELDIKSQLHWNRIHGFPNKEMIMKIIHQMNITIINIVIDTSKIKFINSIDVYKYFSGYLYERICWYVTALGGIANINISSRGNLKREEILEFINKKNHNKFKIDNSRIKKVKIYPNAQKKLLQLADCCCSALGQALKYCDENTLKYIYYLKPKFYSYNGKYMGYGLKYVPSTDKYPKSFCTLIGFLEKST